MAAQDGEKGAAKAKKAEIGLKDDVPRYPRDAEIFGRIGGRGKISQGLIRPIRDGEEGEKKNRKPSCFFRMKENIFLCFSRK